MEIQYFINFFGVLPAPARSSCLLPLQFIEAKASEAGPSRALVLPGDALENPSKVVSCAVAAAGLSLAAVLAQAGNKRAQEALNEVSKAGREGMSEALRKELPAAVAVGGSTCSGECRAGRGRDEEGWA